MKTNISIYLSRILMPFSLLFIFVLLLLLLMPDIRPYDNRVTFVLYNIMLAVIVLNLFFVRPDYKSSIFTKAVYIVLPIIAIIFDILVLTSSLYRLIEYGITPNKIVLVGTGFVGMSMAYSLLNQVSFLQRVIYIYQYYRSYLCLFL